VVPAVIPALRLAPLDLAVVTIFAIAIVGLGFSAKLRSNTVLQFLAAGRSLTLPFFVATLVSTWYGGILGIGESVTYFGWGTWLLLGVPYYLFALIHAFFLAERVRGAEEISLPERLESRFGRGAGLASGLLVFLLAIPAAHMLMLGVLVQLVTGWSLGLSVVVSAALGAVFMIRGGLLADVRVSVLAFLMMYVGFALIAGYCLVNFPLGPTLASIETPELLRWNGGAGPFVIVSFLILGAWTLVDPGFHQRVASSADPSTGRKGVLVSVFFWFAFDAMTITTGMYALALLDPMPANPIAIFPAFGDQVLPPGLKAVFLCGMLGTIVSAMTGYLLVGGASFGRELVARLRPGANDAQINLWSRLGILGVGVLGVGLALRIPSVVGLWYEWGGVLVGALLLPVGLAYRRRPTALPPSAVVASMLAAFGGSLGWMIYGKRSGNEYLEVQILGESVAIGTLIPALAISGTILTLAALFGGSKRHGG
jgi:solute:Na+ symporter, SSS family